MPKIEFRMQETKMSDKGDMVVSGYANMTEQYSRELGTVKRFKEKITRGAFTRAIENSTRDIDFLAEHDDKTVLASTKNGTLQLEEDENGLYIEARIINTSTGRDWYEMIRSGLITNMSFGFVSKSDEWKEVGKRMYERTINELELFEVSAVRNPAYTQSTISSRGFSTSDGDVVPDNIKEDLTMEQRSINDLFNAITVLNSEIRALREERGTQGTDENGKTVSVQKDNYAVAQQTSKQADSEDNFKVIGADEDVSKYYGNKEIDDKGSYNHDKKVPVAKEDNVVVNEPESQSGTVAKYDGSLPSDVPGNQNDAVEKELGTTTTSTTKATATTSTTKATTTTSTTKNLEEASYDSRSISYDELSRTLEELRGGND